MEEAAPKKWAPAFSGPLRAATQFQAVIAGEVKNLKFFRLELFPNPTQFIRYISRDREDQVANWQQPQPLSLESKAQG